MYARNTLFVLCFMPIFSWAAPSALNNSSQPASGYNPSMQRMQNQMSVQQQLQQNNLHQQQLNSAQQLQQQNQWHQQQMQQKIQQQQP